MQLGWNSSSTIIPITVSSRMVKSVTSALIATLVLLATWTRNIFLWKFKLMVYRSLIFRLEPDRAWPGPLQKDKWALIFEGLDIKDVARLNKIVSRDICDGPYQVCLSLNNVVPSRPLEGYGLFSPNPRTELMRHLLTIVALTNHVSTKLGHNTTGKKYHTLGHSDKFNAWTKFFLESESENAGGRSRSFQSWRHGTVYVRKWPRCPTKWSKRPVVARKVVRFASQQTGQQASPVCRFNASTVVTLVVLQDVI